MLRYLLNEFSGNNLLLCLKHKALLHDNSRSYFIIKAVPSINIEEEEIAVVTEANGSHTRKNCSDVASQTDKHCLMLQTRRPRTSSQRESAFSNMLQASSFSDPLGFVKGSNRLEIRTYKSAIVLISIVIFFSLTQSFRLALKLFEVFSTPKTNTMKTFMVCLARNR